MPPAPPSACRSPKDVLWPIVAKGDFLWRPRLALSAQVSSAGMSTEFNHLTVSVRNLARSIAFYTEKVGLRLEAAWDLVRI
jgi:hypothetical protein